MAQANERDSDAEVSTETIEVYLGDVQHDRTGRNSQIVAGDSSEAKREIEESARVIAEPLGEELPEESEWETHNFDSSKDVWKVDGWQIKVETCQIEKSTEEDR